MEPDQNQSRLVIEPMSQFEVDLAQAGEMTVQLGVAWLLAILAFVLPFLAAIWLGRRFQSRWVFVWGPLAVIVLHTMIALAVHYLVFVNPSFERAIWMIFFAWFP